VPDATFPLVAIVSGRNIDDVRFKPIAAVAE
jgi:hypothetical protein